MITLVRSHPRVYIWYKVLEFKRHGESRHVSRCSMCRQLKQVLSLFLVDLRCAGIIWYGCIPTFTLVWGHARAYTSDKLFGSTRFWELWCVSQHFVGHHITPLMSFILVDLGCAPIIDMGVDWCLHLYDDTHVHTHDTNFSNTQDTVDWGMFHRNLKVVMSHYYCHLLWWIWGACISSGIGVDRRLRLYNETHVLTHDMHFSNRTDVENWSMCYYSLRTPTINSS